MVSRLTRSSRRISRRTTTIRKTQKTPDSTRFTTSSARLVSKWATQSVRRVGSASATPTRKTFRLLLTA
jgi:hypothetical protein